MLAFIVFLVSTVLLLSYLIYDALIMPRRKGELLFTAKLKRVSRLDGAIFIGLLLFLLYQNAANFGEARNSYLLMGLLLLTTYTSFIRTPLFILKKSGFFYANIFIPYYKVKAINQSEDGTLVIDLKKHRRRLLIRFNDPDDLARAVAAIQKITLPQ